MLQIGRYRLAFFLTQLNREPHLRLLVVEDEHDLRLGLCQALREEGFAVDEAADGETGLYKAQSWDYDAIILDWMLPKRSGLELLKTLRAEKKTPVIVLTARDALDDRVRGLNQGADDYLVKPFELAELIARVHALIRRSAGQASTVLQLGHVLIDFASKKVFYQDQEVELAAREYHLIELLVLRRNELVSRSTIYDHLFDEDHDSMSNLVDVYISRIRSKLGKDFVTTRRGMGYIVDV